MKLNRLEVLTREEIQLIHSSTLDLLETVVVMMESVEARNILKEHGAIMDENDKKYFVKIPEELVIEQLKNVPNYGIILFLP